eukprot:CAMPEP_0177590086 /NCGR_PEP_ID=MMETSP0419_2-20121207/7189_1 /TAXON_ID=582737 /ORGANISM="Tetraselmis sp., Strain GSL018" /LENGTH=194 /DNA_ID=CAMNT_0019080563 /DNA_START=35 /DNA_END=616 /DNA_ORIENTATION=-
MSWAAVAGKDPVPKLEKEVLWAEEKPRVAVVDANAIISGLNLQGLAERAVTVQEVLGEIRDKKSREWLAGLPFKIDTIEPTEASVKAVTQFARLTGDLRSLSKVDILLLALAHDLELRVYGGGHLRKEPLKARTVSRPRSRAQPLPGWGTESAEWAELDAAIPGLSSGAGVGGSRVAAALAPLSSDEARAGGAA